MSHDIVVRFTDDEAAALQKHKDSTLVPMSQFIRRAVRAALAHPVIDADSEQECKPESILLPAPIAATIQELKPVPLDEPKPAQKPANIHMRLSAAPNRPLIVPSNPPRLLEDGE